VLLIGTAIFGALGAMLRYYLSQHIKWKAVRFFPLATLIINLTGSALLGVLYSLYELNWLSFVLWQLLGVGMLGAYTTFSTFSFELYTLIQQKRLLAAGLYVLATVLGGVMVAIGCIVLVKLI
jgi:CrcB protein